MFFPSALNIGNRCGEGRSISLTETASWRPNRVITCSLVTAGRGRQGPEGESSLPLKGDIEVEAQPRGGKSLATGPQVTVAAKTSPRRSGRRRASGGWAEGASTFPHFQDFLVSSCTGPSATPALPWTVLTSFEQTPFRMLVFVQGLRTGGT